MDESPLHSWQIIERYYAGMVPKIEHATMHMEGGRKRWPTGIPCIGARVVDGPDTYKVRSVTYTFPTEPDDFDAEAIIVFVKVRGNRRGR